MAIAITSQDCSKLYSLGAGNSWESTSSELPMIGVMSYHYPPLSPADNEMGMPPQGFMPSYTLPSQQLCSMTMADSHAPSLGQDHGLDMKGSYSAPNNAALLASEAEEQQQNGNLGEKKRNKLGYHRTSVACGHCRRRKIRCITSPNDTQGRCINCIRLKKDCSFFPVDQASIDDSRSKQTSKSSTGPKGSSATSSPATPISNPVEQPKKTKPPFVPSSKRPGPITVPKITEAEGVKGFPPQTKASGISPTSMTPPEAGNQHPTSWIITAPEHSPTSSSNLSTPWHTYATGSPMSAQFSPFTSVNHSPSGWPPVNSEPVPQGDMDMAWGQFAPPTRSMSYGGEPLSSGHPSQYSLMAPGRQFERRPSALSDAYTTSMSGMVPGFDDSSMNTVVPFPPNAVPATNYAAWNQTQAYPGYTYVKNQETYGDDWSHERRGQDQQLQGDSGQQVINNATMNAYQTQR
ncbi:hypothetical protein NOF04DRAFT_1008202 [Fusarium oxysporum II5]|uniref:Zn(2)-C6 fungal-type domain-containing protein n=1 Tax=Fusarium odoratissimum (strain NRRL 54006) TaxID=1089451 RepID=X0KCC8_FUSO5|nr:uncharacterized protein FOIG_00969 [Fusarium odoratissimum NRRL 54006]EXM11168.1 hypothetical protein FOIG_00969 [Fusarium odoratissimum NRRL 54006]KAK2136995.1 hypothetical protein NOF04DRAFT_1008202 [Fusarium oxysporum II5]